MTRASGHAERLAALAMLDRLPTVSPITLAADRGFDAKEFVLELRDPAHRPEHQRPTFGDRSPDEASPRLRREPAGSKAHRRSLRVDQDHQTIAGQSRSKLRGSALVRWLFTLAAATYNLVRLLKLLAGSAWTTAAPDMAGTLVATADGRPWDPAGLTSRPEPANPSPRHR